MNGYVVTTQGDTLRGQLAEVPASSGTLAFRTNGQSAPVDYTPNDLEIIYYSTGVNYQRLSLPELKIVSQWGEVLSEGKATLYLVNNRFILKMNASDYHELKSETRTDLENGKSVTRVTYPYKGLLNYLFNDCAKVKEGITASTLTTPSLRTLVNNYNSCFGKVNELSSLKDSKFRAGIVVGVTARKDTYSGAGEAVTFLTANSFKTETVFLAGVMGQYVLSKRMNITLEIQRYSTTVEKTLTASREDNEVRYSYSSLQISILPHFDFLSVGLIPYVMLGPTMTFMGNLDSYRKQEIKIPPSTILTNEYNDFYNPGPAFGLMAGAGIRYQGSSRLSPFLQAKTSFQFSNVDIETSVGTGSVVNANQTSWFLQGGLLWQF
ncbi:MAG: hypothetical protein MUE95_06970 [Cyclobacteriaceae bacterium]|nr:hypothetical protein [Cyclobacteriaceae bacterium]